MKPKTFDALQALLPDAHIEEAPDGELVIWTGWATEEDGTLVSIEDDDLGAFR